MNLLEFQIQKLREAGALLLSPSSILNLPQLIVAFGIAIAFLAIRQKRRRGAIHPSTILRATLSRRIILNRSTYADLFYYFINTFAIGGLIGWGLFSAISIADWVTQLLRTTLGDGAPSGAPDWTLRTGMTLVTFIGYEFGYYLDHYLKHKVPFLWEFHKTHHSAETLTPLTVFRVHPVDSLIFVNITSFTIGAPLAVFAYMTGNTTGAYLLDGGNIITVAFGFLLAQLQHTQFWIPFTGFAGRLLLSPAHHQIHHSIDPAHYDRNLGSVLGIWDWMFGTLCVPQKESPRLKFGTIQTGEDPHSVRTLLIGPIEKAFATIGLKQPSPQTEIEPQGRTLAPRA